MLNRAGYARYDESTSRYLQESASLLQERYGGDLRALRDEAGRDPDRERQLIQEFTGIGEVGADIFCREVQVAWDELYPFLDERAAETASALGLPADPKALAKQVSKEDYPRLVAALVRQGFEGVEALLEEV